MDAEVHSGQDHPGSTTRRVARNTLFLALADMAGKTLAFFYYLLAARHLGVERYGVLSFALAFTTMLGVLTDLGLGAVVTREVARDRGSAQSQVDGALAVRIVVSLVVMAAIFGLVNILRYPAATIRVVCVCSACVLTSAISTLYCSVFQGLERMELVTLNRVVQTLVLVIGAVLLVGRVVTVETYALVYAVSGLATVVLAGFNAVPRLVRLGLSFDIGHWWQLLRSSAPIGLATVFTMFYYWIGTTLLSKLAGNSAVGFYSAAFRLATGLGFIGMAFSGAVFPLFSRLFGTDQTRLARVLSTAARYMVIIALPVAAFATLFAQPAILLVYGSGYHDATIILRVLVWWGAFASLNSLLSNYLISVRRPRTVTMQTGLSLTVNLGLTFLLIPVLGALGAAVSLVVSEAIGLLCLVVLQSRSPHRLDLGPTCSSALRVVVALGLAILVAVVVSRWNVAIGLVSGLVAYCLLLFSIGAVGRHDLRALRPVLGGTGD
jgi:O-antigen/teichoic acid export membrane protein